jgi:hypothetical protein
VPVASRKQQIEIALVFGVRREQWGRRDPALRAKARQHEKNGCRQFDPGGFEMTRIAMQ